MTFWRSSLLLAETRTASPWIWGFTFGNSSRISLLIFLASSSFRPRRSAINWRTLFPPAGSTLPQYTVCVGRKVSRGQDPGADRHERTSSMGTAYKVDDVNE